MSTIYNGQIIETELSNKANGGTEQMRARLLKCVDPNILSKAVIHLSRMRAPYPSNKNILWAHDLCGDVENKMLIDKSDIFEKIVFVSHWQRDSYINEYNLPYSKCTVIKNAIETEFKQKPKDLSQKIRFIYHTTPHRGLELAFSVFKELYKEYDNKIHFDVFSSFELYGWKQRDLQYAKLFGELQDHPGVAYHGSVDNQTILKALEKSHIFLYPSIWQETSCISMIESIVSGVICIHPNYGALSETAAGNTLMYDYTENVRDHVLQSYTLSKFVIEELINNQNKHRILINPSLVSLSEHKIDVFSSRWTTLLETL